MRLVYAILATFGCIACCTTAAAGVPVEHSIIVSGSATIKPVVDLGAQWFRKKHPTVSVASVGSGSLQGLQDVRTGAAMIGMVSRSLRPEETKSMDLVPHVIGFDGIVLIVHTSNPIENLTREQVRDLYTRKTTNWRDVGSTGGTIKPLTLGSLHGTAEVFHSYLGLSTCESLRPQRHKGPVAAGACAAGVIMEDHRAVLNEVNRNPDAVGYVSFGHAVQFLSRETRVRLVRLDGIAPTVPNVQSGRYPISRPLLLVTKGKPPGIAREFIEFLSGPRGQAVVYGKGFIRLPSTP